MARPTPRPRPRTSATLHNTPAPPDISLGWLLRALLIAVGAAATLAYCAVCLLVYQGSWQFILHPSRTVDRTPASIGIPFEAITFDAAATGKPRLTGWWIPGTSSGASAILFLHDGQGSLSSSLPLLNLLHRAGPSIFAIDYRGFGQSDSQRPSQASMEEDAAAALTWLTDTRHVPRTTIVPYGTGLAAELAARLASSNPDLPAVILDNPDLHTVPAILTDPRGRLLPLRLLVHDRFDLTAALANLQRPLLFLVGGPADQNAQFDRVNTAYFKSRPDPKFTVELPPPSSPQHPAPDCPQCPDSAYVAAISRFLDTYLPSHPQILQPDASPAKDQP